MPVMHFRVRWPDDSETNCYSPSLIIKDYFEEGKLYPLADFLQRSRAALDIASERVKAKYGYFCSSAMDQLGQIESIAQRFDNQPDAAVEVVEFTD
ncbi:MAG: MSMEG_0570 family nitrogen starvation response protein [Zoogloeaceae bacterium]|nr:MSMEG_0570 family nitrogen starvation response protein [Zoogloeaceae bacterium]